MRSRAGRVGRIGGRRPRAGAAGLVVSGIGLVGVGTVGMLAAHADSTPGELGSYALVATAPGFEMTEDEPGANAHPEGQGAVPETSSLLENGGTGYALASAAWPGATAANGGDLLLVLFPGPGTQLPVPAPVGSQPVPIPDAVGQAVHQNATAANYPVRAEARTGSAPDSSLSAPGITLTAHADTARVEGTGSVQGANQPGVVNYGSTSSNSTGTVKLGVGRAVGTSTVHDVDIGGVVKIKSVTSVARAQTNGKDATAGGGTVVSGMTIGGQPASVGENGVTFGDQGVPLNAVSEQIANQAMANFGMKIYVSHPQLEHKGASASYTAGSLLFYWLPPGSKNVFTATFGGARVSVASAPADLTLATAVEPPAPLAPPATASVGSAPTAPAAIAPEVPSPPSPPPVVAPSVVSPVRPGSSRVLGRFVPIGFRGVGVGWVLAGLAGVGLMGFGSWRLLEIPDTPARCPLESLKP